MRRERFAEFPLLHIFADGLSFFPVLGSPLGLCFWAFNGVFGTCEHEFAQLGKRRPLTLLKLEHETNDFDNVFGVSLP